MELYKETYEIEDELNNILEKYDCVDGFVQKRIKIYTLIKEILGRALVGKHNVAIRCGGIHTYWLVNDFLKSENISCIIDKNISNINKKLKQYNWKYLTEYSTDIDLVIISSYDYRKDVRKELEEQGCTNYVDIYEELEKYGIFLSEEYYHYYDKPYKYLIELRNKYDNAVCDKENILFKLIEAFLDVRDFVTAFEYMEEYIQKRFVNFNKIKELKTELEHFLNKIQDICVQRETEDIIWYWQDGLQTYIVDKMPFYQSLVRQGMNFKNSFTPSAVTRSVYARILDGVEEFDIYNEPEAWEKNHKTIQYLIKNGYKCYRVGRLDEDICDLLDFDYHNVDKIFTNNAAATEVYWAVLRILLRDEEKKCILCHTGLETHLPVIAPNLNEYKEFGGFGYLERFDDEKRRAYLERLSTTVLYVDKQWEFYYKLLSKRCIKIYMSDHGDILNQESEIFTRDLCQNRLTVVADKISPRQYDELFLLTNFSKMLEYIVELDDSKEANMFSQMIRMTGVDAYNREYIEVLTSMNFLKFGVGYDGFMTLEDRYIMLATGEEVYHVFPDEHTNKINDEKYQDRIQWYREKMKMEGFHFIDINKNKKFEHSHLIYERLGKPRVF